MKKNILGIFVVSFVFGIMCFTTVHAANVQSNLFKSTNLLGLTLLTGESGKFYIVDTSATTTPQTVTLPSLSGRNGALYVIKKIGGGPYVYIQPTSGEKLEGTVDQLWGLGSSGDFITFIADETNGDWWVIGMGTTGI